MGDMDDFSQRFSAWLRRHRPEWAELAKPDATTVEIEIPATGSRAIAPLWISSADDEITVGFDHTHSHFAAWDERQTEEDCFEQAAQFAEDLMIERLVVVSGLDRGTWAGSTTVRPDEDPLAAVAFAAGDTVIVRSFRGTFDRDLPRG